MYRYLVMLALLAGLAGFVPDLFGPFEHASTYRAEATPDTASKHADVARIAPQQLPDATYLGNGRTAELEPNTEGHFVGQFRINGHRISGMVDTGATYIAMNKSTARELGINPIPNAYRYSVSTANGMTKAAHSTLARVEIGPIAVTNVDAFIMPDSVMTDTLIGMSFLKKLKSYEMHDGVLDLRQ